MNDREKGRRSKRNEGKKEGDNETTEVYREGC
jgi:hypothetical protein